MTTTEYCEHFLQGLWDEFMMKNLDTKLVSALEHSSNFILPLQQYEGEHYTGTLPSQTHTEVYSGKRCKWCLYTISEGYCDCIPDTGEDGVMYYDNLQDVDVARIEEYASKHILAYTAEAFYHEDKEVLTIFPVDTTIDSGEYSRDAVVKHIVDITRLMVPLSDGTHKPSLLGYSILVRTNLPLLFELQRYIDKLDVSKVVKGEEFGPFLKRLSKQTRWTRELASCIYDLEIVL